MKTLAILEGWGGGPKLTRQFTEMAREKGLHRIKNATSADFVIAHSQGCYMLPKTLNAQRIMLIDPTYWPGESIVGRWVRMNKAELKILRKKQGNWRFFKDKLWEIFYIFTKPRYTWSVLRNQSHLDFLEALSNKSVILIRNINDEFCSPEIKEMVSGHKNISYAEVPGYHANYYIDSQPYIDLLLKEI